MLLYDKQQDLTRLLYNMKNNNYVFYKRGIIYSKAPHKEEQLTEKNRLELVNEHNAWFIRNTYNFDSSEKSSFWFVIKDSFGGMPMYSALILSLIHISEPTRLGMISYAVFCLKKKKNKNKKNKRHVKIERNRKK
eukprot:TRINITY_DN3714_c0_g2_i1.p1 TRINITY_DN3714_c0_g2~~TRINITY_DN3714_c0_g2_i1.p1  ORF type:complete len:135 (+),score=12.83 TRINITY_DN3714_c0_g2_i1:288-692(+)